MSELRIVGDADVRRLIDSREAVAIAEAVFRDYGRRRNRLSAPSAMTLKADEGAKPTFKIKGATVPGAGVSGFRLLSKAQTPGSPAACNYVALYANATGRLEGLVDERWLGHLRTAATGATAAKLLARKGARTVALFGAGRIAAEIVPMLALAIPIAELRVHSRRAESTDAFVARFAGTAGFAVRAERSPERAVRGADVVVTLSEATEPLVRPGWLAEGALVCTMGSHNEVDFGVLAEAGRFIVDDLDYALEMGDVAAWVRKGAITAEAVAARVDADIGEVACGAKPGRTSETERILAIIQGMAMGDVAFAARVLEKARRQGLGNTVDLP
ncbi:MAG: ornithine cyclodeaminase family protein [Proteobacteria bacterium]|nr:ornithine cyclodeaminase family protein [Pseudomonadota bacterium]